MTEARYRLLVETSTDIIIRANLAGQLVYVSPASRVLGYEPEELVGSAADALVHPDDLERFNANSASLLAGGVVDRQADRAHRYRAKNGDWVWLEGNPQVLRDEAGRPLEILNAFRDVSQRKRTEEALAQAHADQRRQDERMALAVGAAQVGIWEWDSAADTLLWDDRMHELHGDRWVGSRPRLSDFELVLHPDDKHRVVNELRAAVAGGGVFDTEYRIVLADGVLRHIRAVATVTRGEAGARLVGTNWDITPTRTLEAAQRTSDARLRNVVTRAHEAIVSVDRDSLVIGWNSHAEQIFGWTEAEAIGRPVDELIFPPILRPAHRDRMAEFLSRDDGVMAMPRHELIARHRCGREFPIEVAVSAVPGPDGWEVTALMHDISERKAQSDLFETAFQSAPIGMALVGPDGRFLKINGAFCRIVDRAEDDVLGLDFQAITHPEDLESDLDLLKGLIAGDIPSYQLDKRYLRADGSIVWVRLSVSMVTERDGSPRHFIAQVEDLTAHREAEARYRLLTENATDGIACYGADAVFTFLSPSVIAIMGYEPHEMVGQSTVSYMHPDDVGPTLRKFAAHLAAGPDAGPLRFEYRAFRKDGAMVWLEAQANGIYDDNGKLLQFQDVIRDITARKAVETALADSELRYRVIADNCTDVISRTAVDGRLLYLSPSISRVTGFTQDELVGQSLMSFMHPDDVEPTLATYYRVLAGEEIGGKPQVFRTRHKSGEWLWMESNPTPVRDASGAVIEFIDVTRDVGARIAMDAELRAARDAAEAAAAAKSDFMANMSHEIRTPLTAILGFTKLLEARPDLDEVAATHVQRVAGAGQALLSIVNDILDFSKLEAGQVEIAPRPVSPSEVLRETLLLFSPQADAKGLALEFASADLPDCVAIDPDRIRQILLNLIGNAIKFTDTGSVRLVAGYDRAAGQLQVRVEDTGAGLDEVQQRKLFQRFSQVDASSTRRHGGTGLGLAISKGLAEAMGGAIGVTSVLGQGSCFFFSLDAPPAELVAAQDVSGPEATLEGVRALVVDDNPMNRELARALLEHFGAEVSEAEDGLAALDAARAAAFDIVLLDIRMPGLDGPATLARIRAEPGPNRDIPILAFSADAGLDGFQAMGFDDVVAKPLDPTALITAIIRALTREAPEAAATQVA